MADCSLDEYIVQKGIGLNTKRTIGAKPLTVGRTIGTMVRNSDQRFSRISTLSKGPQEFDARRLISKPTISVGGSVPKRLGTAARLGGAKALNVGNVQRSVGVTALSVGAAPTAVGSVSDARQKILAKTKFGDARERILTKKIQNEAVMGSSSSSGFDIRQKLKAKQGFSTHSFQPSTPEVVIGPEVDSTAFNWNASSVSHNVLPIGGGGDGGGGGGGVTNFGGSLQRTVNNPTANYFGTRPAPVADPISVNIQNSSQFPNSANSIPNPNNFPMANVMQQKQFLQTFQPSSRFPVNQIIDQQPIQTVISQPPVKVMNRPIVPALSAARLQATPPKRSDAELVSPLQGFCIKISNLHPNVSQEDIIELFGAIGALKRGRLVRPGYAEVVFVNYEDAVSAVTKYHMRELDGLPMNLLFDERNQKSMIFGPRPSGDQRQASLGLNKAMPNAVVELEPSLLNKALFEVSSEQGPRKQVTFTVRV